MRKQPPAIAVYNRTFSTVKAPIKRSFMIRKRNFQKILIPLSG
jgi:hypothetical protein